MWKLMYKRKQGFSTRRIAAEFFFMNLIMLIIFGQMLSTAAAENHSDLNTVPCDIRLVFGTDKGGMPSVSYKLGLQIRNRSRRHISGVSVYWLSANNQIIGNSSARCSSDESGIAPSEAGNCEVTVQHIGGPLLRRLGEATWTEIINHELAIFKEVKRCAILGYDYYSNTSKTY